MSAQYAVGIDLGTTNSCLAFARPESGDEATPVELFPIAQLINRGEVGEEALLPSALYLPQEADMAQGVNALPWDAEPRFITGVFAQKRGIEVPGRLVTSAKSWLSHAGVDRASSLLPINAPEGVEKISPVEASRRYLEHMRHAWDQQHPEAPLAVQQVLITVPASFDAVARDLTLEAAKAAGYGEVVLLEEPQAAFYAWLERHPDWRDRVHAGDLILVADVGGGTTDFTLITVFDKAGSLELERVAVGEHILLGGDNIDLALARSVEQELAERNVKLDSMQLHTLWQRCRVAKEKLLSEGSKAKEEPVTILGRGTGLIGGTIKASLKRNTVDAVLHGFLPETSSGESPEKSRRIALTEVGLPYASDAAIPRHLAKFLRQPSAVNIRRTASGLAAPTHVLLNGGVFRALLFRERIMQILNGWLTAESAAPAAILEGEDLMHAVARGAAYYGQARQGRGIRIRGGVPRTYYVGVESAMPAVPGMRPPMKALVVAPFGMEEGTSVRIEGSNEFGLLVGEPAEFRFFASSARKKDPAGTMIEVIGDELEELSPVEVLMEEASGQPSQGVVRVTLESLVTETGVLELWCVARDGRRWKLEFNVRERVQ